jgi:hypothetical protein
MGNKKQPMQLESRKAANFTQSMYHAQEEVLKCRGVGSMARFAMDIVMIRTMDLNRFYLERLNDSVFLRLKLVIDANRKTTKF